MKVLSRTALPVSEKVYLAAQAMTMSDSFGEASALAERYSLSRPTLYELGREARAALGAQFEHLGSEPGVLYIRLDRAQLERAAVALRAGGPNSVPQIHELLPKLYPGLSLSYGRLHGILSEAERRAEAFNARVSLSGIVAAALDEMFSQGKPILTGIDLDSGFVAILKAADSRSGDDWGGELELAGRQGFDPAQIVSDAAQGIKAGVERELPGAELRDDSFHAGYELSQLKGRLERQAYAAIEAEHELALELRKAAAQGKDQRAAAQRLRRSRQCCLEAITLFDAFETEARLVQEALEVVDVRAQRLRTPEQMKLELGQSAERICALPHAECKRVGRYLKNRIPGLVLYCQDVHGAFRALGERWGTEAVRLAALVWQAAELIRKGRQRWARAVQVQTLWSGWSELRRILAREPATELLEAIEQIFAARHRASSALEGFHAGVRPHLYVHKGVSQGFLELYRAYYNLHTTRSGRNKGTSAYERLTGEKVEDWLTMLGYPPSASASRN